jgi:hypothetical protein
MRTADEGRNPWVDVASVGLEVHTEGRDTSTGENLVASEAAVVGQSREVVAENCFLRSLAVMVVVVVEGSLLEGVHLEADGLQVWEYSETMMGSEGLLVKQGNCFRKWGQFVEVPLEEEAHQAWGYRRHCLRHFPGIPTFQGEGLQASRYRRRILFPRTSGNWMTRKLYAHTFISLVAVNFIREKCYLEASV